ncbi:hypothetical protein RF55_10607 [Lasius niger]|uniref:RNA-directed DNA polymerase n=1 Tax=Lasius niger TaxID=67767 RepID=A0A0J7KH25_LASNI|nr:hypothetical protein RF55_10607 [Lasius niger]
MRLQEHLSKMSLEELQQEARSYGITDIPVSRELCIDLLIRHLGTNGPLSEVCQALPQETIGETDQPAPSSPRSARSDQSDQMFYTVKKSQPVSETSFNQFCLVMTEQMRLQREAMQQQQQLMQQLMSPLVISNSANIAGQNSAQATLPQPQEHRLLSGSRAPDTFQASAGQSVKFLSSLIPAFGATDEEDVELWLEKIESVADIHSLPHVVMLSAATAKLTKTARRWFDLSPGEVNRSWICFKTSLLDRFRKKILYDTVRRRAEARKWIPSAESFQDYAMDKLALTRNLKLEDADSIQLLIGGISDIYIGCLASSLRVDTLNQFLREMQHITLNCNDTFKKFNAAKFDRSKDNNSKFNKPGEAKGALEKSSQQKGNKRELHCVYCRSKDHVRNDCPKLRRKEAASKTAQPTTSSPVAAVDVVNEDAASTIACVQHQTSKKLRRFAWMERLKIREITDDLLERGIIKHSSSPYCARVVPVRKKNGAMRLCVDLRPLNSRVLKQKFPFPLIEDCLSRLNGKTVFTLLDLKDGFYNIKLDPEVTKFFAFATPDGQFEYTRLPFGFCEAPAEFQRRLIQILQPLIRDNKVIVYIDDILIPSSSVSENLIVLKQVLVELKRHDFQLNYNKCAFLKSKIEYLGYIVSAEGITLSPRHIAAVENFPVPKKTIEVQRFLGLTNYFRKFIKDYATKARPLHNLLRKSVPFVFEEKCQKAFNILKNELVTSPVLSVYDPFLDTEIHTDASAVAVAGILLQKQKSGCWSPTAYFSQATNQAECKYHSFELEMLAIVKTVERFHIYLYGLCFTIVTDCHALVHAVNKANINPRIARWILKLQNYKFNIVHRNGTKMAHVDALSRVAGVVEALPLEKELEYRQLQDPKLKFIAKDLEYESHEKFDLIEGLVYRKGPDKPRFVVPDSMIRDIIRIYHDKMAHCGVEKTVQGIGCNYWFPSLRKKKHADSELVTYLENLAKIELDVQKIRDDSRAIALESSLRIKDYNKSYYDEKHKKPSQYKEGDYVLIRAVIKPGEDKKLKPQYKGPYIVAKVLKKNRYVIKDIPGFNIASKPYDSILSPDRMKLWVKPVDSIA